ncbi:MAG: cytidylate kinase [Gammaproteobacteria bacterium]|nr:cytidylate kinase [Gammaproteobacteria bacterium]MAY02741.1 cytidylate kinase [Gammaproteobacteria bacterium]|tara:strand:+ start:39704 stop:40387 length:684 start_codon:yes stop_codon:yes gene_type:complete
MSNSIPVITIDGPSGTGKGTISGMLSKELGWHFLDSGALYRLVAVGAEKKGISYSNINDLVDFALAMEVQFSTQFDGSIELNGEEVSALVREESSAGKASQVAAIPEIRQALSKRQRVFRQPPGLVADGRDMGTVIFPDALCKFFLTASPEERAQRRYKQLINKGLSVNLRALLQDIQARDERDSNRAVSPLVPAEDAHVIDTSDLSIDEVFTQVLLITRQALTKST